MADSIVDDLLDLFPDTVVAQPGTYDSYGVFTPVGAAISVAAQVTGKIQMVKDINGQEVVSHVMAIIAGTPGLTVKHQYTLPSRFVPNNPKALSVDQATDESGAHHETVYF